MTGPVRRRVRKDGILELLLKGSDVLRGSPATTQDFECS